MKKMLGKNDKQLLNFCENVKFLRECYGFTQTEMAKKMGIGVKSLRKIENGEVPPRLSCIVLFTIQREFGIEPTKILKHSLLERDIL